MVSERFLDILFATGSFKTDKRHPALVFFIGLLLGAAGLALYLRSWRVLFTCLGLFTLPALLIGGSPLLWAAVVGGWGAFAVYRAKKREQGHPAKEADTSFPRVEGVDGERAGSSWSSPEAPTSWGVRRVMRRHAVT